MEQPCSARRTTEPSHLMEFEHGKLSDPELILEER
jgi:hypothetical protein